jgi:hypothetical protein
VYVVLEGSATLVAGGEEHELQACVFARVGPGPDGVTLLCLGGVPGSAYTPPAFTEAGAPWR